MDEGFSHGRDQHHRLCIGHRKRHHRLLQVPMHTLFLFCFVCRKFGTRGSITGSFTSLIAHAYIVGKPLATFDLESSNDDKAARIDLVHDLSYPCILHPYSPNTMQPLVHFAYSYILTNASCI